MSNLFVPEPVTVEGAEDVRVIGADKRDYRRAKLVGKLIDFDQISKEVARDKRVCYSSVSVNFMMSTEEAAGIMGVIMARHGISPEADCVKLAFVNALIECYAVNSSSLQMPGRATFTLFVSDTKERTYDFYTDVIHLLGDDARRFFRAYADYTRDRLKLLQAEVLAGPEGAEDLSWDAKAEMWDHVLRVASDRGLFRYPYLIHDSADACTGLTAPERMAVINSKAAVTAAAAQTVNLIDGDRADRGSLAPSRPSRMSSRPASFGASKYDDY